MHWLIDVGGIKTGGAVQIALNRLPVLATEMKRNGFKISLLLPSEGPLSTYAPDPECVSQIIRSPNNWLERIYFEYFVLQKWIRDNSIAGIYTVIGFGLPHPKKVISIVTMANATSCYPDSVYWQRLRKPEKIKRLIYTHLRQKRLKCGNFWILETEIMRQRCIKHLGLSPEKTMAINPSPTSYIQDRPAKDYKNLDKVTITLLTGNESHKNLDCLVAICDEIERKHAKNITFNISLTKDQLRQCVPNDKDLSRLSNICFLGKIPQQELQSIYDKTDILMNLSELESFSNNYMEAWKAGLAQICSNRDFARHICEKSAYYVEPLTPSSAAEEITNLLKDKAKLNQMAANGKEMLKKLATQAQYIETVLDVIKRVTKG